MYIIFAICCLSPWWVMRCFPFNLPLTMVIYVSEVSDMLSQFTTRVILHWRGLRREHFYIAWFSTFIDFRSQFSLAIATFSFYAHATQWDFRRSIFFTSFSIQANISLLSWCFKARNKASLEIDSIRKNTVLIIFCSLLQLMKPRWWIIILVGHRHGSKPNVKNCINFTTSRDKKREQWRETARSH